MTHSDREISPELARSLYEDYDEYMIDFQRKLGSAETFEMARDVQVRWNGVRLTYEEMHQWFAAAVGTTIAQLDTQAHVDGVMGQPAAVEGSSIKIPKFDVDLRQGIVMVSSHADEERDRRLLDRTLHPSEYHGPFAGFMPRFEQVADSDLYRPVLSYQFHIDHQAMPHIAAQLMVTADVEEARLQFDADACLDKRWGLLSVLYDLAPHCASSINRLVTVLAEHEELTGSHFRHIGYHAAKIVDTVTVEARDEVEDTVIDLIASYLDLSAYQLETRHIICADKENMGTLEHLITVDQSAPIQVYSVSSRAPSMVFMDHSTVQHQQVFYHEGRMLHAVVPNKDDIRQYVQFTDIADSIKL